MTRKNHIDFSTLKNREINSFVSLKLKRDIDNVFKNARAKHLGGITLRVLKNDKDITRLLIIPMHGYGNAVTRNLLKRRVREIIRNCEDFKTGYDIVIAVNKTENHTDFATLKKKIENLFMQSGLIIRGN